ncbi:MAG TPA: response regulator, partial [Gemmatimonadaceae bacterium]|nr:response regulator [Gemmatimonadaceae bacterium]
KVYLPRLAEAPSAEPAESPTFPAGGSETLLVVEDDPSVRALARRLLERLGYTVIAHASGAEALAWLAGSTQPVHLLLTDVVMPGMNGRQLADQVETMRPGTRVLFTSGYTANVIVQQGVLKPNVAYLPKPYNAALLARRVREVLDGPLTAS